MIVLAVLCLALLVDRVRLVDELDSTRSRADTSDALVRQKAAAVVALTAELVTAKSLSVALSAANTKLRMDGIRHRVAGRFQRMATSMPIAGALMMGYFEKKDFESWLSDHPELQGNKIKAAVVYGREVTEEMKSLLTQEYSELRAVIPAHYLRPLLQKAGVVE